MKTYLRGIKSTLSTVEMVPPVEAELDTRHIKERAAKHAFNRHILGQTSWIPIQEKPRVSHLETRHKDTEVQVIEGGQAPDSNLGLRTCITIIFIQELVPVNFNYKHALGLIIVCGQD